MEIWNQSCELYIRKTELYALHDDLKRGSGLDIMSSKCI